MRQKLRENCERLLRDIPQMRIAIMAHGDYCDYHNYVERHVDFTSDVDVLVDFAEQVPKTGGGDSPEVIRILFNYDFFIWTSWMFYMPSSSNERILALHFY